MLIVALLLVPVVTGLLAYALECVTRRGLPSVPSR